MILFWSQRSTKLPVLRFINRGQYGYTAAASCVLCTKALMSTKRGKYYIIKASRKQSSSHLGISGNSITFIVWVRVSISGSRVAFCLSYENYHDTGEKLFILVWILSLVCVCCLSPGIWFCNWSADLVCLPLDFDCASSALNLLFPCC